ncbi:TPA: formate/nitrite transporter, partial [Listeria monocytogenes]|nr:formate/nitrite transporter [Listeria monocytogenes]HBN5036993.1 formate/nitrite transporter [Listeria monocytogenes]HEM1720815.1 formate/nitrite transporter [Listeria monocytogenes]
VSLFYFIAYKKNAPKKVKEEIHQPIEES